MFGGLAVLVATIGIALLAPAGAGAYVYWANFEVGTIGRAANDNSVVEPEFITGLGSPFAVAVDSTHIYWANGATNSIGRASLSGSAIEPEFIKGAKEPLGIAVDASHVYWGGDNLIGRANINGSAPEPEFIMAGDSPCGLALDSGHIYWASALPADAAIARAGLSGTPLMGEYVEFGSPGPGILCGVAVDPSNIFWTEFSIGAGTNIGRANTATGKGIDETFIGAASGPCGITEFGGKLYGTNGGTSTIARANTDGTVVEYEYIHTGAASNKTCGIAVDGLAPPPPVAGGGGGASGSGDAAPPETRITAGPGKKLAEGIAKFRFASSEVGSSFKCKLDRGKAKRCASPKRLGGLKAGRHAFSVWAVDAAGNKDPTPARRGFRVPAG
jgi:DNA-binding beta-propeller fold protein YncE